jgi:DNA-binding SARP family transcriptional activator
MIPFRVLGPLEIRGDGGGNVQITGIKQRLLLAVMLLHAGEWVSRGRLTGILWDDARPTSATANLKTYVWELRKALLGSRLGNRIESRSGSYRLIAGRGEIDVLVFEDLLERGRRALSAGERPAARKLLEDASGLWRGELLEGLPLPTELMPERVRLEEQRWEAVEEAAEIGLDLRDHARLISDLRRTVMQNPLRERPWEQLMRALHGSDRRAEALDVYQEAYRVFDAELGLRPGPRLRTIHQAVLSDVGGEGDAGREADFDLAAPPPPAAPVPAHLPPALTSFTGRAAELDAVLAFARGRDGDADGEAVRGTARICAIDGMPGIGKTALAVQAAHRLAPDYPDGQLFLDLCGFTEGAEPVTAHQALGKLLHALGLSGEAIPPDLDARVELYRSRLAGKRMLILLDNAVAEEQVRVLLPAACACLVLITSRNRLNGLDDVLPVPLDTLPMAEATDLFVGIVGTRRADAEPSLAQQVVALCDRLPLAIRIAAARLRARPGWSLAHLSERLRDSQHLLSELSAGERSVSASFQLSYTHVARDQQRLLRLLGLHPGTHVTTDAAAALAGMGRREADRLLEALVDANLLYTVLPGQYRMHDLIRHYAIQVAHAQEPATERRDAERRLIEYWTDAAWQAAVSLDPERWKDEPPLSPPPSAHVPHLATPKEAIDWFEQERANLVAAVKFSADRRLHGHVRQLANTLSTFFNRRGYFDDWIATQTAAVEAADHAPGARAESLLNLGRAHQRSGDQGAASDCYEAARRIYTQIGNLSALTDTARRLGWLYNDLGHYDKALTSLDEAAQLARITGDVGNEVNALNVTGMVLWRLGRYRTALAGQRRALQLARALAVPLKLADTLNMFGLLSWRTGWTPEVVAQQHEALELFRSNQYSLGESHTMSLLGIYHADRGDYAEALRCQQQALTLILEAGHLGDEALVRALLGAAHAKLGHPAEALADQERALELAYRAAGDPALVSEILAQLAFTYETSRDWSKALEYHTRAYAIAQRLDIPFEQARACDGARRALVFLDRDQDLAFVWHERALEHYARLELPGTPVAPGTPEPPHPGPQSPFRPRPAQPRHSPHSHARPASGFDAAFGCRLAIGPG